MKIKNAQKQNKINNEDYLKTISYNLKIFKSVLSENISNWRSLEYKKEALERMPMFKRLFDFNSNNKMYFFSLSFYLQNNLETDVGNIKQIKKNIKKYRPDKKVLQFQKKIRLVYDNLQKFEDLKKDDIIRKRKLYLNLIWKIHKRNEECKKFNSNLEKNIVLISFEMIKKSSDQNFVEENKKYIENKIKETQKSLNEEFWNFLLFLFEKQQEDEEGELKQIFRLLLSIDFFVVDRLISDSTSSSLSSLSDEISVCDQINDLTIKENEKNFYKNKCCDSYEKIILVLKGLKEGIINNDQKLEIIKSQSI